jgi:predicted Ser/Thr protein kinase
MSVASSGQNMTRQCPQCGAPVSEEALEGLCPACLLRQGVSAETATQGGSAPFEPPDIGEIARLFPQLEIVAFIGKGGMGAVYKARQPALDRMVALKILPPQAAGGTQFTERFAREARALARLNHPNIVAVHDFGQVNGMPFFVMEFVDGLNLREMERSGKLSPREALQIVPQICEALQFAHDEGVVHRDIKPENILLDKKGRVKIADFGIAKIMGAGGPDADAGISAKAGDAPGSSAADVRQPRLTEQGKIIGTPNYMAPEQVETPQSVDHRADIFSLGVVFYEMLTGELPLGKFAPPSSCTGGVAVDVRLDEVVLRALEREPERRYQQASQVKTAVQNITDQPPVPGANRMRGINYRSRATLFGLPLLHVATDVDPATNRPRVARGIVAIGGIAQGVLAFGGIAMGGVTFGGVSLGVLAFGGCAVGVGTLGGLAVALVMALGGLAIAPIALGGGAIGYFAQGGGAWGIHPLGANASDEVARHFFTPWAGELLAAMNFIFPALLLSMLAVVIGVPFWLQHKAAIHSSNPPAPPGSSGFQGANQSAATPASLGAIAVFFAGLAGVLGIIALCLLPTPPGLLVWAILESALLGIMLGMVSRKTTWGRRAMVIGAINTAIWLGIATVFWLRAGSLDLPPPGGLVGWWAAEGNADDLFGTNNGILDGGVGFAAGRVGRAFSFDGINGTVIVPDSRDLRLTGQLTIAAWINTLTTNGDQGIISKLSARTGNNGYQFDLHGNQLTGAFNSPGDSYWPTYYVQTPIPIIPGTWNHVAWTYNQNAMILYFNGQPMATNVIGPQIISVTDTDLRISGADDHVYFKGLIDEASVYRTALSAAQIETLYKLGMAGQRPQEGGNLAAKKATGNRLTVPAPVLPGLVGWWPGERSGVDIAGANDGTLFGGVTFTPGEVGEAFQFNGTLAGIHIPASASLNVGTNGGFTIEGWIKPASLTVNEPLAVWNNGTDNLGVHLQLNQPPIWGGNGPGSIFSTISDTSSDAPHNIASPANVLSTNNWNHVALTYDQASGMAALYVNGVAVTVENLGVFTPQTSYDFYLGFSPQDPSFALYFYTGLMDEMSLYNMALSPGQIQAIYRAGSAGKSLSSARPAATPQPPPPAKSLDSSATFSVAATGTAPLSYQWYFSPTAGSPSAETWSPTLAPGEKPDFQKIMGDAKELMNRGQYEEALQREIWYFNHSRFEPGQGGVRLSFALSDWIELGRRYPKAKQALIEIRDRETSEIKAGRGYSELFSEVQAINHELQDDDATYALFLTMRTNDPQLAGQCYIYMENSLVAKGEYQWCYDHMGDPQTRFDRIHQFLDMQLDNRRRMAENRPRTIQRTAEWNQQHGMTNMRAFSPPDTSGMLGTMATNNFVGGACQLIEILVGTGHADVAQNIRDQAVKVVDDARLHSAIEDVQTKIHAKQAEKPGAKATSQ